VNFLDPGSRRDKRIRIRIHNTALDKIHRKISGIGSYDTSWQKSVCNRCNNNGILYLTDHEISQNDCYLSITEFVDTFTVHLNRFSPEFSTFPNRFRLWVSKSINGFSKEKLRNLFKKSLRIWIRIHKIYLYEDPANPNLNQSECKLI
jgi:hypothetical protein